MARKALAFVVALGLACGAPASAPSAPPPHSSAPRELLFEAAVDHTQSTMRAVHDALPQSSLRAELPLAAADWLDAIAPLSDDVVGRIDPETPVRLIAVARRLGDEPATLAAAARIRSEGLTTHADPTLHYASWVGEPSEVGPVLALSDGVLVAAEDRATLELALPYLVTTALTDPVSRGVRLRVPAQTLPRVRTTVEAWIEDRASSAIRAARAERGAHPSAPPLGEPEALIAIAQGEALRWAGYLPDAGAVEATIDGAQDGLRASLEAQVRSGSPLARAIEEAHPIDARPLLQLPRGTAWAWLDARSTDAHERTATLRQLAGARMDDGEAAAIEHAITAWPGPSMIVLGRLDAPFAAVIAPGAADAEVIAAAVHGPYASGALGMLLGCDEPAPSGLALCRTPPSGLELATSAGRRALVLRRGASEPSIAVRLLERQPGQALADAPDVAREGDMLAQENLLLASILAPSRFPGALGLIGHPALARLAAQPGRTERDTASIVTMQRTPSSLRIELRATGAAIADLAALLAPLLDD